MLVIFGSQKVHQCRGQARCKCYTNAILQFIEKVMNLSLWKPMETDETIRTIVTNSTDSIVFKVNTNLFCTNANQYHINLIPIFVNVVPTFHRNPLTEKNFHMSQWYVFLQIALYHSENAVGVFQSNLYLCICTTTTLFQRV